jgi:hypothetical protein
MLLNRIPVLDKGFVAPLTFDPTDLSCLEMEKEFKLSQSELKRIAYMTILIKCPLFVLLNFYKYGIKVLNVNNASVDAYVADESEIGTADCRTNKEIADHIAMTVKALLLSIKGFTMDGCDPHVAQTVAPVSTYVTVIASASVADWEHYVAQKSLPRQIELYRAVVDGIIKAEWPRAFNPYRGHEADEEKEQTPTGETPESKT